MGWHDTPGSHSDNFANAYVNSVASTDVINGTLQVTSFVDVNITGTGPLTLMSRYTIAQFMEGRLSEFLLYSSVLSDNARYIVEQYKAAKWDFDLAPPGSGATEADKAMASTQKGDGVDGFSAFTTRYLEKLSQTADIDLHAGTSITLDLQGDTLDLTNDRNITLTTDTGDIATASAGTIQTNGTGNITFFAGQDVLFNHALDLTAAGSGAITIKADRNIDGTTVANSFTTNGGTITFNADVDQATVAGGGIDLDTDTITTNGGDLIIGGGANPLTTKTLGSSAANDGVLLDASTISTGAGDITIRGEGRPLAGGTFQHGIILTNNTSVTTTTGDITLEGEGFGLEDNRGVYINGGLVTSAEGDITFDGTGGGTNDSNHGVLVNASAIVSSTGTGANAGTITFMGTSGAGTNSNYGVYILTTSTITSVDGDISITGTSTGTAANEYGIRLNSSTVSSTGTGANAATISFNGTGGVGTNTGYGIFVDTDAIIRSIDGNISLTGVGNGSGYSNYGTMLQTRVLIESTGTDSNAATITIHGTGGNGTSNNRGAYLLEDSIISSGYGDISFTGIGQGSTTGNNGILIYDGGIIRSTGTGNNAANITINGTGGNGTDNNYGIYAYLTDTLITTVDGDIAITGTGNGSGTTNYGMRLHSDGVISSTGTGANAGTITMTVQGGDGGTIGNYGTVITTDALLTSAYGDITINTTGGAGTGTNYGTLIDSSADITSTGTGANAANITITSTAGAGANLGRGINITAAGTTVTTVDGDINITGNGTGTTDNNLGILINGGSLISSTGTGENAGNITLTGTGAAGTDSNFGVYLVSATTEVKAVDGDITINGTGGNSGTFNYGVVQSGAVLSTSGTGDSAGNITYNGIGGAGTNDNRGILLFGNGEVNVVDGDISLTGVSNGTTTANYGIIFDSGGKLNSTGTGEGAGNITLNGTSGNGTNNSHAVYFLAANSGINTVDGDVNITGLGRGSGSSNYGFIMNTAATINSTGTGEYAGNITIDGMGADGTSTNYGVILLAANTKVTTVDGDISITGTGGSDGTSISNHGLYSLNAAEILSTGTGENAGTISLTGVAGSGTASGIGIHLNAAGTLVRSVDGDITLNGTGNGSTTGTYGVLVNVGSQIISAGTGANAANITAIGLSGIGTDYGYGLYVTGASTGFYSVDGYITLSGTSRGTGVTANRGFFASTDTEYLVTGSGNLSLTGAGMNGGEDIYISGGTHIFGDAGMTGDISFTMDSFLLNDVDVDTLGTLTMRNRSADVTIGVGTGAGTLSFTDAIMANFSAGGYTYGSTTAGALDVNTAYNFGSSDISLISGYDVTLNTALTTSSTGDALTVASGEDIINNHGAGVFNLTGGGRFITWSNNFSTDVGEEFFGASDHRYARFYGLSSMPETGSIRNYSSAPRLIVTPEDVDIEAGTTVENIGYTVSGWLTGDEVLDSITGAANYSATAAEDASGTVTVSKLSDTLLSRLGYNFTFLDSTGSVLQGAIEEIVTPPSLPETTPVIPETPTIPVTPTPISPELEFEAFYGGELITGYSNLPETVQQDVMFTYLDAINSYDMVTYTSFLELPSQLVISDDLLKYYRLNVK